MEEDPEVNAMATMASALSRLDSEAAVRVIEWAAKRYGGQITVRIPGGPSDESTEDDSAAMDQQVGQTVQRAYSHFADLFDAANPTTDVQKTLVASYWLQKVQGQASFVAQRANDELKNLGHGVKNVTDAFAALQNRKPALVVQTAKSGRSRQSRKTYKLTEAGIREVQEKISSRKS